MALSVGRTNGDFGQEDQTHDLSLGDTNQEFVGVIGFPNLSFGFETTGLNAPTARVQIQKINRLSGGGWLDIVGATLLFGSGDDVNDIEISGAKNESYRVVLTVNTVNTGTLITTLIATK